MSLLLLGIVVLAWGFSWYGITLQIAVEVHPLVSVGYRFVIAAGMMLSYLALRQQLRPIALRDHGLLAMLGVCLFSMNFFCFYMAADALPSGVLSVIFGSASIIGALNQWLILKRPLDGRVLIAAAIGITGLALMLWDTVQQVGGVPLWKLALPLLGTYLFSIGNLISLRLSSRYEVPNIIGQGMIYGALACLLPAALLGMPFPLPANGPYWGGMVFLAIVSSIIAFLAYLSLVNREGPARAAYATVLFPVIAMMVSTWLEGFIWSLRPALGLVLVLGGSVMIFARPGAR